MKTNSPVIRKLVVISLIALVCTTAPGCGTFSTLYWWVKGQKVKAQCDKLEKRRVAIVCATGTNYNATDLSSQVLARDLEVILAKNVKGIEIVRQEEIRNWKDTHDWDQLNFKQIGRGVKAEMVLAVELANYSLSNGSTLRQGSADVTVSVYDISNNGNLVFRDNIPGYVFPRNGGQPVTDISSSKFERKFLIMLSQKIANYFYDYDLPNDFAQDAIGL